ncbi:MAG: hypothetical protein LKM36_02200 [Flavobacteriales bacterium]|jgi:hypothetical protein|nr:hypothetical protein [Flavobacteriales bacterium]MCI1751701.1 hypothetical protein [Flavobacteriales bacterium]
MGWKIALSSQALSVALSMAFVGCTGQPNPEKVYRANQETFIELNRVLRLNYPLLVAGDTCNRLSPGQLTITPHDYQVCFPTLNASVSTALESAFSKGVAQQITLTQSALIVQVGVESTDLKTIFYSILFGPPPTIAEGVDIRTYAIAPGVIAYVDVQDSY